MANQYMPQGNINRLHAAIVFGNRPELNVTSSYLSREGISVSFDDEVSLLIPTLTGAVSSPVPYAFCTMTIHLVRSQHLASAFKRLIESDTYLGQATLHPDADTLLPFELDSVVISKINELPSNGTSADFTVVLKGIYRVNSHLWT